VGRTLTVTRQKPAGDHLGGEPEDTFKMGDSRYLKSGEMPVTTILSAPWQFPAFSELNLSPLFLGTLRAHHRPRGPSCPGLRSRTQATTKQQWCRRLGGAWGWGGGGVGALPPLGKGLNYSR